MKIQQVRSPEQFNKITKVELYELCFGKSLKDRPFSNKEIAILYGVTEDDVKKKKAEFGLTPLSCALLFIAGGPEYRRH